MNPNQTEVTLTLALGQADDIIEMLATYLRSGDATLRHDEELMANMACATVLRDTLKDTVAEARKDIIVKTGDNFFVCAPSDWFELDPAEHYDTWPDTAQARKEIAELRDDNILWDLSPGCFSVDANTGIEDLFGTVNHLYTMVDEGFLTARAAMLAITGGE